MRDRHLRLVRDVGVRDQGSVECAYCLDLDVHRKAAHGNVLCLDGKRYDVCDEHYGKYRKQEL